MLSPPLPSHLSRINPLNPQDYKVSQRKENPTTSAISQMLSLMWNFIYLKQIISRDYSLVEQSKDGIIVCRPYLYGIKSDGVKGEMEYNLRLMNEEKRRRKPKRKCLIFSCKEDLQKWVIYRFFEMLERELNENSLKRYGQDLENLRDRWLTICSQVIKKNSESLRKEIEMKIPELDFESSKSTPWECDSMVEKLRKRKSIFSQIWDEAKKDPIQTMINEIKIEKIKKKVTYTSYNEYSFWRKFNQFIERNIKREE